MNYHTIEKGTILGHHGLFYVVVSTVIADKKLYVNCICDNANNIYAFEISDLLAGKTLILSPSTAVNVCTGSVSELTESDEKLFEEFHGRSVPLDVMAEVLSGHHDKRFDHWYEEK
jgi:hypothetical protein